MKAEGQCHICGKRGPLSYEHVPPEKAFNSHKQFIYLGKEIIKQISLDSFPWDCSGIKGTQKQKGIGFYTLCGKCNNDTGGWYGNAFVDLIFKGYRETFGKRFSPGSIIEITLEDIYPLRIIKQIIAMFFSINSPNLSIIHEDLRLFVLNKETKGIPTDDFCLYIYLARGSIGRYVGRAGILQGITQGAISHLFVSELSAPPFGLVLQFEPKDKLSLCDITFFANQFDFYDKASTTLKMPVLECNTYFPCDYRTKDQVLDNYVLNKLYELRKKSFEKR